MLRSGPTLQSASAVDNRNGEALIMPPPLMSWSTYQVTLCEVAGSQRCFNAPPCGVVVPGPATCPLPGLDPGTSYRVYATATEAALPNTMPSNNATLTTPV